MANLSKQHVLVKTLLSFELFCALPCCIVFAWGAHASGRLTLQKGLYIALITGGLFAIGGLVFWAFIAEPVRRMRVLDMNRKEGQRAGPGPKT